LTRPQGTWRSRALKKATKVYDRDYKIVMVNAVHKSIANVLLYVKDQNGDDVRVTPEHPFMRENSTDKTIPAGELRNGLELPLNKTVSGVTAHFGEVEVINLSVTGSHTFIANGWAVHNKGNL
jgi:intein/homing endonuclease